MPKIESKSDLSTVLDNWRSRNSMNQWHYGECYLQKTNFIQESFSYVRMENAWSYSFSKMKENDFELLCLNTIMYQKAVNPWTLCRYWFRNNVNTLTFLLEDTQQWQNIKDEQQKN